MNILEFFGKTDSKTQKKETIDFHKQTVCY